MQARLTPNLCQFLIRAVEALIVDSPSPTRDGSLLNSQRKAENSIGDVLPVNRPEPRKSPARRPNRPSAIMQQMGLVAVDLMGRGYAISGPRIRALVHLSLCVISIVGRWQIDSAAWNLKAGSSCTEFIDAF